jgi:kynureninase
MLESIKIVRRGKVRRAKLYYLRGLRGKSARGNFLAFEHPDAQAWYKRLHDAGIVTDVRGSRLRVGFGLYQNAADVDALVARLRKLKS